MKNEIINSFVIFLFSLFISTLRLCAFEILDDFIPTCRQDEDMIVGLREEFVIRSK
jgi:hypothetical protein